MIVDALENAGLYEQVHHRLKQGFDYIRNHDFSTIAPGKYEIDGDRMYALVQEYEPKPQEDGQWEAHKKYLDIQYMFEGEEKFGFANIEGSEVTVPYQDEADFALFAVDGSFFTLRKGSFAVLFPQDLHMPGIASGKADSVKKVVVKVLL